MGFIDGQLGPAGEEIELHHGEGLEMDLGETLLQATQQVGVVGEGEVGVQAAHDVKLGHRVAVPHGGVMIGLLQGHGVAALAGLAGETAELAVHHADIGGIQVPVDVEITDVPVPFLPDPIGQSPHGMQVRSPIESDSLLEGQSLPGEHLVADPCKLGTHPTSIQHEGPPSRTGILPSRPGKSDHIRGSRALSNSPGRLH